MKLKLGDMVRSLERQYAFGLYATTRVDSPITGDLYPNDVAIVVDAKRKTYQVKVLTNRTLSGWIYEKHLEKV